MIKEIINSLNLDGTILYLTQYGSHLYGVSTNNSDIDIRGIFKPSLTSLVLQNAKDEINAQYTKDGIQYDIKLFSLHKFIHLCSKGDTNALDVLFSMNSDIQHYGYFHYDIKKLYDERHTLINTDNMVTYTGFAMAQATRYGIKSTRRDLLNNMVETCRKIENKQTTIQDNIELFLVYTDDKYVMVTKHEGVEYLYVVGKEHQFNLTIELLQKRLEVEYEKYAERTKKCIDGKDWKALSHAIRCVLQLKELYTTGDIKFPLKEKELVLKIKQNELPFEEVNKIFYDSLEEMEKLKYNLNWKYDKTKWDKYIWKECTTNYNKQTNKFYTKF